MDPDRPNIFDYFYNEDLLDEAMPTHEVEVDYEPEYTDLLPAAAWNTTGTYCLLYEYYFSLAKTFNMEME